MVNFKRVVCEVALCLAVVTLTAAAPTEDHYDQRQNGTENYRLNIDGVVIAVAPAESLLAAASEIDFSDLFELEDFDSLKPPSSEKPENKPQESKPQDAKPEETKPESPLSDVTMNSDEKGQKKEAHNRKHEKAQRLKMRLANMLLPLLKKNRHH